MGYNRLTKEQELEACKLYEQGLSTNKVALSFNYTGGGINSVLRRYGIQLRPQYPKLSDDQKAEICKLYQNGIGLTELAEKHFKCARIKIRKVLEDNNIKVKSKVEAHRKALDESVFDVLTPDVAYWIGFLLADGNVSKRTSKVNKIVSYYINLVLQIKDKKHIEKFHSFLKSGHRIRIRENGKNKCVGFNFKSNHIAEALMSYGVVPRKSYCATVDGRLKYDRDFWRGMIDGDGSLGIYDKGTRSNICLSLCGTEAVVTAFQEYVRTIIPESKTQIHMRDLKTRFSEFALKGRPAYRIIKDLYEDNVLALGRKNTIAQRVIQDIDKFMPGPKGLPGESSPVSKLNNTQVKEIRSLQGTASGTVVAKQFGVHHNTIYAIWNREHWRHVA